MANQVTGFTRIYKAAGYSWKGLKAAWQNEAAFRQEASIAIPLILLSFWFDVSPVERILLVGSVVLVCVTELLNSAVECAIDRIGSEFHVLSGRAKDIGSAAVLLTIILAFFVWVSIFWPRWF